MRCVIACVLGACGPTIVPRVTDTDAGDGCVECEPGPPGAVGPAGPPGPAVHVWVDATGAIVTESAELIWIDPATGYVWSIDPNTGEHFSGSEVPLKRWYENDTCSGTAWLAGPPAPRVPFRLDGVGSIYMVRPDSVPTEPIWAKSYIDGSGAACAPAVWLNDLGNVVPEHTLTSTGVAVPPPSPWIGPLHLELP
jgi:hypothetical protein